ncbi:hypothetical protein PR003_g20956 [Phytophthora rubi]|uniref:Secreted protein n=1 Tax=Phytophthora rubi TaxID=129364 RepID=A0A6A3KSM0_9STRA|nr:hypothetical protein PR001_g23013 [Phytophthora rubi]KAE9006454.1 hypothetical protein PR002_g16469 [Phytophthora rubi]KAE9307607.1 hypothetical protein PR003_g20956 [Phytophthora rubi]
MTVSCLCMCIIIHSVCVHAQLLYLLEACCATTCRANTTKAERQMAMCGSQKGPSTAGRFRSGSIPGTDYSNVTGM